MASIRTISSPRPAPPASKRPRTYTPIRSSIKASACRISNSRRIQRFSRRRCWRCLRGPLLRQLPEHVTERGYAVPQLVEIALGNNEHLHWCPSLDSRVSALIGQKRHFAEIVAGLQSRQQPALAVLFPQNIALAFFNYIHAVAKIALLEHHIPGLKMLVLDSRFRVQLRLCQLRREQQMQQPVRRNPCFTVHS